MYKGYGLRRSLRCVDGFHFGGRHQTRHLHYDGRNRLSNFWTPTQNRKGNSQGEDSHDLLIRAGFLRQAHSGIFHLLPLGLRVQDKLERLIDKHMLSLGASKVSLSSLSSEELWQRSGRLEGRDSEFLRLKDRKGSKYLLSPTHEEEITTIVANAAKSYKDLPLRLYQVSRKYRDEARPRQGLLRGREFLMKDLYTFDVTDQQARETYEQVRAAYSAFLDELRLPYLVANADSGNMGGNLSHEYHFVSANGEDNIISCTNCDYSVNEELFIAPFSPKDTATEISSAYGSVRVMSGIGKDRKRLLKIIVPLDGSDLNVHVVKKLFPDLDTAVEDPLALWQASRQEEGRKLLLLYDPRVSTDLSVPDIVGENDDASLLPATIDRKPVLLTKAKEGDSCPSCHNSSLKIKTAVEIGHTFHLGTRYSKPLDAKVLDANNKQVDISMGCHGIGVSRLIGAVASLLADAKGLSWPVKIAPFGAVLVPGPIASADDVSTLYDGLLQDSTISGLDFAIDDRERPMGWKLNDADLIGYPFIVVLGKAWSERRAVELQCRRLGIKEEVSVSDLAQRLKGYSEKL